MIVDKIKRRKPTAKTIENKVDIIPYIKERDEHLKNVAIHKLEQRKLNRIYKIIFND